MLAAKSAHIRRTEAKKILRAARSPERRKARLIPDELPLARTAAGALATSSCGHKIALLEAEQSLYICFLRAAQYQPVAADKLLLVYRAVHDTKPL